MVINTCNLLCLLIHGVTDIIFKRIMRGDIFKYQAQTTLNALALEVSSAKGSYIYSSDGKKHLDFAAGVSACTLGHQNTRIVDAIKNQVGKHACYGLW